jgi:hypothetical protein
LALTVTHRIAAQRTDRHGGHQPLSNGGRVVREDERVNIYARAGGRHKNKHDP